MNLTTQYPAQLDPTSKKYDCPQCGKKRFVRCIDVDTKDYLPDHVGRCDRENGCGYEYTWNQYFKENGVIPERKEFIKVEEIKPIEFLSIDYVNKSFDKKFLPKNNLFLFLKILFTERIAIRVVQEYLIGTSSYWKGANIYWQIDEHARVRQCKIMLYNPETGKRVKEGGHVERLDKATKKYIKETTEMPCSKIYGKFLDDTTKDLNLQQCFFGQHLLTEYPEKDVCIVESEKTALILSVVLPQFIWLATGGASGCKWRDYEVYKCLTNRIVTFFPDYGLFNVKSGKTCFTEWSERLERIKDVLPGKFNVSSLLENRLKDEPRKDQDLADLFMNNRDETTGLLLTEFDYPVIFDYKIN